MVCILALIGTFLLTEDTSGEKLRADCTLIFIAQDLLEVQETFSPLLTANENEAQGSALIVLKVVLGSLENKVSVCVHHKGLQLEDVIAEAVVDGRVIALLINHFSNI